MRNQHARVVLAACLFAAAAAAQGTFDVSNANRRAPERFGPARLGTGSAAEDARRTDPADERRSRPDSLRDDPLHYDPLHYDPVRYDSLPVQQGESYAPADVFMRTHGDFMSRYERYKPMISVGASAMPDESIRHEPGHFDEFGGFVDASMPWRLWPDGYLLFGAYGAVKRYQFKNMGPGGSLNDETLYGAGVKLGFGAFLEDNLLLEVETHPGMFTDADGPAKHQDFDFPSFAMATWQIAPNMFLKGGARYNQVYHDVPWLPLLGISWDITGSSTASSGADAGGWRLDVLLPEHAEVSYWPSSSTGFLLGVDITGAEYRVRTSASTNRQQDNLQIQEVTAYLGMIERLSENFSFTARLGAPLAGQYDLTTGANGYNRVEGTLTAGLFAEVSVGFDF